MCVCAAPDVVSGGSSVYHVSVEMSRFYRVFVDTSSKLTKLTI